MISLIRPQLNIERRERVGQRDVNRSKKQSNIIYYAGVN